MSNTPRTDRYELYYIETGNVSKLFVLARELESELAQSKEANAGLMQACDNLERELADMTKQRDELAALVDVERMQPVSDTPRTDAETWRDEMDHVDTDYMFAQSVTVSADFARQIERELADMTKQRDRYKAACDQYSEDEMLCRFQEVTKQRDSLAKALLEIKNISLDKIIELHSDDDCKGMIDDLLEITVKALAAMKEENHATLQG